MDEPQQKRHCHILVADDDRNDFLLVQLAFQKAGLEVNLSHVLDGQQAVNYLTVSGQFKDRAGKALPDLLLLDLKMPMMDGFDVLALMKKHPSLHTLPVIVLSASQIEEDINRARELGARDFLTKPADFGDLVRLIRGVFARWLQDPPNKTLHAESPADAGRQWQG
jgi:CheY-like chemotaxis protein